MGVVVNASSARQLLEDSFRAAIGAADPRQILADYVDWDKVNRTLHQQGRIVVVGAGKAAASMAQAFESAYIARGLPSSSLSGMVVTRYDHALPTQFVRVVEAAHPVPDAAGEAAARNILQLARSTQSRDLLVVLISGGGSALLTLPVSSVPVADLRQLTSQLLASGAPIQDMNVVRKHLSQIQGGRLAQTSAAPILSLIISDVAGDDLSAIASGPTVPDPSTYEDALAILKRWGVNPPPSVAAHLHAQQALGSASDETPKPGDAVFARVENVLIASARQSLLAAAQVFEARGVDTLLLGDSVTGEARDVAQVMASVAREAKMPDSRLKKQGRALALISGGECTVTLRPVIKDQTPGRGGRCSEFLLALFAQVGQLEGLSALAGDTDGIDGSESNAGAVFVSEDWQRAQALDLRAARYLDRNDGYSFFSALDGLVTTGPTLTNVNDYRVILVS